MIALTGGGTGGHAYPSIAVAERLRARGEADLVYYGSAHGPERALAESANIPFAAFPAAPMRGRSPARLAGGAFALWRGSRAVGGQIKRDRPAAMFATGGYVAAPAGRAARRHGVPLLVFLPDVKPGWAVRLLSRYATRIACSVDASLPYLSDDGVEVTGYPLRGQFADLGAATGDAADRQAAIRAEIRSELGLQPELPTLLVTGGSLGAHLINRAVADGLRALLEDFQLIHVSGRDEEAWLRHERDALPDWLRERYLLFGYTEEMARLMSAADLGVTRAGASVLGELPAAGLPALVVPGAFSDQMDNAVYLSAAGAAEVVPQARLDELMPRARALLRDEAQRHTMRTAMRGLARPDAADRLADLLTEMASPGAAARSPLTGGTA